MAHRLAALTRAALLGSLLVPALGARSSAGDPATAGRGGEVRALLAALHAKDPPEEAALARRIRTLGSEVVPQVVDAWADLRAREGERRVLLAALGELPRSESVAGLRACAQREGELAARVAALRLLALLGSREALPTWVEVANELARGMRLVPDAAASLAGSLAHWLAITPGAYERLDRALPGLDRALLPLVARAIGRLADARGIDLLEPFVGEDPALDAALLPALARICARHPGPSVRFTLASFASRLESFDPRVRELAIRALAEARDPEAAALLAERLDDEDALVRRAALEGLQRLGGPYHASRSSTWRTWSESEARWRVERFDALVDALAGADPTAAVRALGELTRHALYAHEIAAALAPQVESATPGIALAMVQVLGGLRCPSAAPALEALAVRPEPEVQRAAGEALRALRAGESLSIDGGLE